MTKEEKKLEIEKINSANPDLQDHGNVVTEMENGDEKDNMKPAGEETEKKSKKEKSCIDTV